MTEMKLVIIESPYAGDIKTHVAYARRCLYDSIHRGESPIASHLLYTQPGVLDDSVPSERELGIAAGLAWRKVADYSIFYTDWGWSPGMLASLHSALVSFHPFFIRALDNLPSIPTPLQQEVEDFLVSRCEK